MNKFSLPILLATIVTFAAPVLADDAPPGQDSSSGAGMSNQDSSASTPAASDSSTTTSESAATGDNKVLKGGVRGSAIKLEEGLGMIEQSAKMVQQPALELAKECTRKETAMVRGPNYIGNGIVIPAIGNPNGTMQIGELPARKKQVESFLSLAEDAIKALRSHVDGLIIPEGSKEEMTNLWKGMQSTMAAAETKIAEMRGIVSQVPEKKGEIKQKDAKPLGRAALSVYDSMTALEKMRRQLDDMVKPELKQ